MTTPPRAPDLHAPVVVTNDDGFDSEGLRELAAAAAALGFEVTVAAPLQQASGTSAAMTVIAGDGRVMIQQREVPGLSRASGYAVQAAPAFIAFTAAQGAYGPRPALLLSGINRGPNTGRAVLHSGTVGAAMTAATLGIPAGAFSLDCGEAEDAHWKTAAAVATEVIPALPGLPAGSLLNVNVPNVTPGRLRGIRRARLAESGAVQVSVTDTNDDHIQVTMAESGAPPAPGSDSALLAAGYASVTVLRPICELPGQELPWLAETPDPPDQPDSAVRR